MQMQRRNDLPTHKDDEVKARSYKPRSTKKRGYRENSRDYIEDDNVFKAFSFARNMINDDNKPIALAIHIAAKYYNVSRYELAKEMGRFGIVVKKSRQY
jgi:hypothetical protein